MAFMTLKTIVSQNKKHFAFFPFIVCLLPSLVNYKPNMTILLSWEGVKDGVTKSNVFKEFVMTLLASARVFQKTLVFDFCHNIRSFCRRKIYSG